MLKFYEERPMTIAALKIDYTDPQFLCNLREFMGTEYYELKFEPGAKYPYLQYNGYRYDQDDYIIHNCRTHKKYRYLGKNFDDDWQEIK